MDRVHGTVFVVISAVDAGEKAGRAGAGAGAGASTVSPPTAPSSDTLPRCVT